MLEIFRLNGLVTYSYCYGNKYNWKKCGDYQCDVADFRQFWRHMRRDRLMSCGCVDFASGDRFIFYRRGEKVRWEYLGKTKSDDIINHEGNAGISEFGRVVGGASLSGVGKHDMKKSADFFNGVEERKANTRA